MDKLNYEKLWLYLRNTLQESEQNEHWHTYDITDLMDRIEKEVKKEIQINNKTGGIDD